MIRELLSKPFRPRIGVYNGVAVRDRNAFDISDHEPMHKQLLSDTALKHTSYGDRVVIVGGGRGVVPTRLAREGREVVVYEAASEMTDVLLETQHLNNVEFVVYHAVVGDSVEVYGDDGEAMRIYPDELNGDVLVLDCEGAETSILPAQSFDSVVVETHPEFGATTDEVLELTDGTVVGDDPRDGHVVVA